METKKILKRLSDFFTVYTTAKQLFYPTGKQWCQPCDKKFCWRAQERPTKRRLTYYSIFFHVCQVRNLSFWRTYVQDVCHFLHPEIFKKHQKTYKISNFLKGLRLVNKVRKINKQTFCFVLCVPFQKLQGYNLGLFILCNILSHHDHLMITSNTFPIWSEHNINNTITRCPTTSSPRTIKTSTEFC